MATLPRSVASLAPSANVTYQAVTASDDFQNGGGEVLHVKNASGGAVVVTINSVKNCDQGFDHNVAVSVAGGADRLIGPFPPERFTDPATGKATVTFDVQASITAAVLAK